MAGNLEGPRAKLERAERQTELLQAEIEAVWPPGKTWPVRPEIHRSGLEYRFYLGELPSVDPEWLLWAGEILFDIRSALDHLAYQLHVRHFRGRLPSNIEDIPMFPIFTDRHRFKSWGQRRISRLSKRDQARIRNLQPYVRRNDDWRITRVWLKNLDLTHNIDKHRKLHVVAAAQNTADVPRFPPNVGFESFPNWGPVESHSHVETWRFAKRPTDVQNHRGAQIEITLDPMGERWVPLLTLLVETRVAVRLVFGRFLDRLPWSEE